MEYANSHRWLVDYRTTVDGKPFVGKLAQIDFVTGSKEYIGILVGDTHHPVDLEALKEFRDCLNYAIDAVETARQVKGGN